MRTYQCCYSFSSYSGWGLFAVKAGCLWLELIQVDCISHQQEKKDYYTVKRIRCVYDFNQIKAVKVSICFFKGTIRLYSA